MNCSGQEPCIHHSETPVPTPINKNDPLPYGDFSHLRRVSITFPRDRSRQAIADQLVADARENLVSLFNVKPEVVSYRAAPEFDIFPLVRENLPDDEAKVLFFKVVYPMYRALLLAAHTTTQGDTPCSI